MARLLNRLVNQDGTSLTNVEVHQPKLLLRCTEKDVADHAAVEPRRREFASYGKFLFMASSEVNSIRSFLVMHMGMAGTFIMNPPERSKNARMTLRFERQRGGELQSLAVELVDPRHFSHATVWRGSMAGFISDRKLGPDVYMTSEEMLLGRLTDVKIKWKKSTLHETLLDQRAVSGIGNYLANEIEFEAGVRPDREVETLSFQEIGQLTAAIKKLVVFFVDRNYAIVKDPSGVNRGGYSVYSKDDMKVYDRTDEPCRACGTKLASLKINDRTVNFCDRCQR